MNPREDLTNILNQLNAGNSRASAELIPLVYRELRSLAQARMRKTPSGQTLQPTALVHEAFLRLFQDALPSWDNRRHFFHAAGRAMHDILVEQARRQAALKRGGDRERAGDPEQLALAIEAPAEDLLALHEALSKLEHESPRQHQLVMLRFFAGLTAEEAAEVLDVSLRTVERDWQFVRARLFTHLTGPATGAGPEDS